MAPRPRSSSSRSGWEVLTEEPNGNRTVHRVRAKDRDAAVGIVVEQGIAEEQVIDAARSPSGLGSG
jgi:hypothetical protein